MTTLAHKHPQYSMFLEDWETCRDCYRGERAVKDKGTTYLPATSGMIADGSQTVNTPGWHAYQAYKTRAVFHEFMGQAIETMIGVMWSKPPVIELPKKLEDMFEKATASGESMEQLLRRINEQQLATGRLGLLLDMPVEPDPEQPLPYIALYNAESIINWDDGATGENTEDSLNLVVLDETEYVRISTFEWENQEKYRVLVLGDAELNEGNNEEAIYKQGVFKAGEWSAEDLVEPSIRGTTLRRIPFMFINSKDVATNPDDPPLLGLARLSLAIYRGEADYRQALFMQGQDTLVVVAGDEDKTYRIGAGATIVVPQDGDAKFIGTQSEGLPEMRSGLENDKAQAMNKSGQLVDIMSREKESGDAMRTRIAAQTATLNQIALSGANALERLLKIAAEWVGADPEEVVVTPNLDFDNNEMSGKDLIELMSAKNMGAPISQQTIHENMANRGLTVYTLDEELELIEEEAPLTSGGPGAITDPDDPNYDPNKDPNYDPEKDPNSSRFKGDKDDEDEDKDD